MGEIEALTISCMKHSTIESLKDGHPQYTSGIQASLEGFRSAVDKLYKSRDTKNQKIKISQDEMIHMQSSKRKEETAVQALLDKYTGIFKSSEETRGNLFCRYLTLDHNFLTYDVKDKREEDIKEINRLGKILGINFGKKNPNEAFFGAFTLIFNLYLTAGESVAVEFLQTEIQSLLPEFQITVTQEIADRLKSLFEYIFQKSYTILHTQIYSEDGKSEFFPEGFDFDFADVAGAANPTYLLSSEQLAQLDTDFDDHEIPNEYLTKESHNGITLLIRHSGRKPDDVYENVYRPEAATLSEVAEGVNLVPLDQQELTELKPAAKAPRDELDRMDAETHELDKDIKADTPFREFYNMYKGVLCKNEYWQISLFNCLDMLSDLSKPTDLLFDNMVEYVNGETDCAIYLSQHRNEIVADFLRVKRDMEKKRSKKAGKKILSNALMVQQNMDEDIPTTNHEVLAMLGMTEKEIKTEEKLGLSVKQLKNDVKEKEDMLEEIYGMKEEDMIDFVNLRIDQVQDVAGPSFSMVDFPTHVVLDSRPQPKAPLDGPLYKVSEFPDHIARAFTGVDYLNQLQTKVKEVAFDSDENMLVCAPTGAGKTNVALLTILREFNKTFDKSCGKAGEFKVVYISPLKALATEIVEKFKSKLEWANVIVREFTGDMGMTRQELLETHIIVSTPEKWDVMTRKSDLITEMVKMIIIDEIHLLDEERGRVLECIVARTGLTIERRQKNIRLVGLSATLPNYVEVARFLGVTKGLFYFDERYRPVPLYKKFIGVRNLREKVGTGGIGGPGAPVEKPKNSFKRGPQVKKDQNELMNDVAYDIIRDNLQRKEQILVFVHSRRDTIKFGQKILDIAQERGDGGLFAKPANPLKEHLLVSKDLKTLVPRGIGSHNAGLCRKDRRAIEEGFLDGRLRIVVCTATLAWGVNLPAHTVIIKGTDVYEPGVGFKDLSILDVQQIFGRAGRPQFDTYGEAVLITKVERMNYFINMMTTKISIRSQFQSAMLEALNAEIALGNITNISESFEYIKKTFFYVRAKRNPRSIGVSKAADVDEKLMNLIQENIEYLNDLRFVRYDRENLSLESTELGRICSHYYVNCATMEKFCTYLNFYENENLRHEKTVDTEGDIEDQDLLAILAQASEFGQLQVRPDEAEELKRTEKEVEFLEPVHPQYKKLIGKMKDKLDQKGFKDFKEKLESGENEGANTVAKGMDSYKKVMILIQGFLSMQNYDAYSLVADTHYIVQNGTRILRCLYEICLKKNLAYLTTTVLRMARCIENNIRDDLTCLRMFCYENVKRGILNLRRGQDIKENGSFLSDLLCKKIEEKIYGENANYGLYSSIRNMREEPDIGRLLHIPQGEANKLKKLLWNFPLLNVEYSLRPIAQTILKVDLKITPDFYYSKQFHLPKENFVLMVANGGELLHHEEFGVFTKNLLREDGKKPEVVELSFFIPLKEKIEAYSMYVMSDRFVNCDVTMDLDLKEISIHTERMEYTELLDLRPLKISVLNNPAFERLYKIKFFNPIQTQLFHALYYTDNNILIGAPTGSGKTIMAELAMLRIFANHPKKKIVYIGPYKALVKERLIDWKKRLESKEMGKSVVELTGDYTPDLQALVAADVLVTTPEKWDGISRSWQQRNYVSHVGLIVFDEIHLLGQDRGPVIEVIVSRMNYISAKTGNKVRFVGLSTAMASSSDVGNWFGAPKHFMFNFRPNVRPVPVEIHFRGFADKNYCPRMNSMNKPAFNDIKKFSPRDPVLIFVSSRRQTRLTALDLITFMTTEGSGRTSFLRLNEIELDSVMGEIQDNNLKQTLTFGIGMHHAGLVQNDRKIIEHLFVENKIQVLIATSTLAWGVNFPAKLVIIKGTEFFDPKQKCYVDMPITDILQMVGRAGRPQFNDKGFACVYVEKNKKNFYRKYLNDPFPIESRLTTQLAEHISAEVNSGTITNKQHCMDYLTWTYWFRRISRNPLFYEIASGEPAVIQKHVTNMIDEVCKTLKESGTIEFDQEGFLLNPTFLGHLASYYYIQHKSVKFMQNSIKDDMSIYQLIEVLSHMEEYDEVPMRHNEDHLNAALANICPYPVDKGKMDDPKVKTLLLFQAYFSSLPLPIRDYITDTKLVLDSAVRFLQAMIDFAAEKGYLNTLLNLIKICQMLTQGCWYHQSSLVNIPHFTEDIVNKLKDSEGISHLCQLVEVYASGKLPELLQKVVPKITRREVQEVEDMVKSLPNVEFYVKLFDYDSDNMAPVYKQGTKIKNLDEIYAVIDVKKVNSDQPIKVTMKKSVKAKDASWWILVCNLDDGKVFSLKKTFFKSRLHREFQVAISAAKSSKVDVLLLSDSFIGLDQVHSFDLDTYRTKEPPRPKPAKQVVNQPTETEQ